MARRKSDSPQKGKREIIRWIVSISGCSHNIPEKNQLPIYEQSHQEVVKIERNTVMADVNKNNNVPVMDRIIGNMNLRIPNGTDQVSKEGS